MPIKKMTIVWAIILSAIIILLGSICIYSSVLFASGPYKNRELFLNLYNIGYSYNRIAKFYQVIISLITLISIIIAILISNLFREYYMIKLYSLFDFMESYNKTYLYGMFLIGLLLLVYNIYIIRNVKTIVIPKNDK